MNDSTHHSDIFLITKATVDDPHVSLILPTYNESKNVAALLRQIQQALKDVPYTYECIFVDDSKDETPGVIQRELKHYPGQVTFVKRVGAAARTGLTQAFRAGFMYARGEILVCMDTDLQHPPALIPRLVTIAERPAVDVAVASRYTRGGSAEGLNGVFRHVVSRVTNLFVHMTLPGTRTTADPMTGFFVFKRSLLPTVSFSSFGFKILVELLTSIKAPRVIDVPLIFQKRAEEESKATWRQGIIAYKDIFRLFLEGDRGSFALRASLVTASLTVFLALLLGVVAVMPTGQVATALTGVSITVTGITLSLYWALVPVVAVGSLVLLRWAVPAVYYARLGWYGLQQTLLFSGLVVATFWYTSHLLSVPTWGLPLVLGFSFFGVFVVFGALWRMEYQRFFAPEKWFVVLVGGLLLSVVSYFAPSLLWWEGLFLLLYVLVIAQGLFALYLMIYAWEQGTGDAGEETVSWLPPHHSFTAIVPAKHEKNTIADTVRAMNRIAYPADKKQILIVIHEDSDDGTIGIVRDTIASVGATNISLVTYNASPINKPHGLNEALKQATGDFVVIFDAEDEPHPDLFSVIDTRLQREPADVLQSGVQLMNYESNWYSTFNVLEYYFWFKSSLHFYARQGVVPLGGVSVFFRRSYVEFVGGWDMYCLTEDAEIGMRLSQAGARMAVVYDARYATQEETPPTLMSFIKQRTRWAQGFLQILARGTYRSFPTRRQRLLALYVLAWPFIIPFVFLLLPLGIALMFFVKLAPMVALLTNVSLLLFVTFIVVQIIGLYEFTREYGRRFPWGRIPLMIIGFYPYTVLLALASLRAMYRNALAITVWEKTEHHNTHRQPTEETLQSVPASAPSQL